MLFTALAKKAKCTYFQDKFNEYSLHIKNTWSLINSFFSLKKKNNSVPELFCDGKKNFSSSKEIAGGF